jgi:predicted HTH transcriptional regulator
VEFDVPVDPQASVEALLAAGEGPQVEYKRQLPDTAEQKRKMLKTAAAFASQDGGSMVFGMDPDEITVVGLGDQDPKKLRDRLYATVIPPPSVTVTDYQIGGKTILVLDVPPGPESPYALAVDKESRDKPEFYMRRGSSTYPAQPGELRRAARSRPLGEGTHGRRTPFGAW